MMQNQISLNVAPNHLPSVEPAVLDLTAERWESALLYQMLPDAVWSSP